MFNYSHHHARIEVEPATSEKDGGPVLCVDNATTFTYYGATATPSTTVVSTFDHTVLTSEVSDTGGFSSPEIDATLSPFSDAPTRPSLEAPAADFLQRQLLSFLPPPVSVTMESFHIMTVLLTHLPPVWHHSFQTPCRDY